jgi:hypothetical protein
LVESQCGVHKLSLPQRPEILIDAADPILGQHFLIVKIEHTWFSVSSRLFVLNTAQEQIYLPSLWMLMNKRELGNRRPMRMLMPFHCS